MAEAGSGSDLFGRRMLYVLVAAAPLVSGALVSPVLAHTLGPRDFGALASAIAVHQVLIVIATLGFDQTLSLHVDDAGGRADARAMLTAGSLFAVLFTGVVLVTGPLWARSLGFDGFTTLVLAAVLWTAPGAIAQLALAVLSGQDRLRAYGWVSAFATVGGQVSGIVLLFAISRHASVYAWGGVASQTVAMVVGLAIVRPALQRAFDRGLIGHTLRLGLPLTLGALSLFLLNAGDRIIIQRLLGPVPVGRYQVAYTVGSVVVLLLISTSQAWTPRFASVADPVRRWELIGASRDQLLRLLVPAIPGITLAAPVLLRIVAPPSFRPGGLVTVTFLVALAAVPVTDGGTTRIALLTLRRGRALAVSAGVGALVNVGVNLAVVRPWGLNGSAGATVLSFAVQAALHRWFLADVYRWPLLSPRLWAELPLALGVSVGSLFVAQSLVLNAVRLVIAAGCLVLFLRRLLAARAAISALSPADTTAAADQPTG